MAPRRPPDILRKSHAHSDGKTRARDKRALDQDLAETIDDAGSARGCHSTAIFDVPAFPLTLPAHRASMV